MGRGLHTGTALPGYTQFTLAPNVHRKGKWIGAKYLCKFSLTHTPHTHIIRMVVLYMHRAMDERFLPDEEPINIWLISLGT